MLVKISREMVALNRSQGTGAQRAKAWESWWSEQRPSHFNAMLARDRRKAAQAQREEATQRESDAERLARAARDDITTPFAAVRQVQGQGHGHIFTASGMGQSVYRPTAWHRSLFAATWVGLASLCSSTRSGCRCKIAELAKWPVEVGVQKAAYLSVRICTYHEAAARGG